MVNNQKSIFPPRTAAELVEDVEILTQEIQQLYLLDEIPWVIGYSGGKDSSTVLQLIWNAIAALPVEKRHKTIHIITTDTLVENPIVSTWVRKSLEKLDETAKIKDLPIQPHLLHPSIQQTFWVCLIGRGYPAPRQGFRWCTDRMKIQPVNHFIRETIRASGEVIVVLGSRKTESITRRRTINKHQEKKTREHLTPNSRLPNSLIYSPIEDWQTNEVWMYLMQWENPWGGDNKDLLSMYQGATADNECPLVVDTSTPSCGDSRFGCWVCTMVSKDKSMEAMIQNDEEKEWMQPLLDIRNELDVENDHDRRDFRRIYGKVELFERNTGDGETSIKPIPGPYTKYWREYWLRRVLEAQVEVRKNAPSGMEDITLIQAEELSEIRRIWLEEKHEFDDSLPRIYQEVTGETFRDNRLGATNHVLGSDEWGVLEELCEDEMHLELMAKLLDTERQYHTKSRRSGIYQSLEKCFETSSRSKEEAIENAHLKRDLKTAVEEKDAEKVKQLTWANIKFSGQNSDQ
ncbi:sulfurtransferase DndC [Halothece sp. PCC 7418]|uniref:DNA phosphorothioation system sulfurtransferase DndC n=1 Tax=Halothece sp. (strain PCC 7418) TaxID=65093 RepID=UPI0002A0751B|nr:DNA phosphorothioation system sulfurtransferase DndC [Halothece sp. PCC 7418]AFZ45148.1 sulfurtransferase DndC [Halothece sp. PCC 7418]